MSRLELGDRWHGVRAYITNGVVKGVYMDIGFDRMDGDSLGWAQDSQYGVSHRLRAFVVWIREERDGVAASEIPWTSYV